MGENWGVVPGFVNSLDISCVSLFGFFGYAQIPVLRFLEFVIGCALNFTCGSRVPLWMMVMVCGILTAYYTFELFLLS